MFALAFQLIFLFAFFGRHLKEFAQPAGPAAQAATFSVATRSSDTMPGAPPHENIPAEFFWN